MTSTIPGGSVSATAPASTLPSAALTYNLHVDNDGTSTLANSVVTIAVPAQTTFASATNGEESSRLAGTQSRTRHVTSAPLETNPTLQAAEEVLASVRYSVGAQKSERWPSFNLSATHQYTDFEIDRLEPGTNSGWTYALSMNFTIFDGLLTKSNIRRAENPKDLRYRDFVEKGYVIAGSPATVRDRIREEVVKGLRVGNLMVLLQIGSMPHELTLENMDLFAREVLPDLRPLWDDEGWVNAWWPERLRGSARALNSAPAAVRA